MLQFLADGIKLIVKEDIIPRAADKLLFRVAPILTIMGFFGAWVIVPFSEQLIVSDLEVGVLYAIAITGLILWSQYERGDGTGVSRRNSRTSARK